MLQGYSGSIGTKQSVFPYTAFVGMQKHLHSMSAYACSGMNSSSS